MAAKTIYTELTVVRQWLNFVVTRRMLAASPVAGTKLVKPKPGPRDYWRQEHLDAIVEAARAPYKAAFLLMAETGMRIGEVVHLTHDDLTLDGPTPIAHIRPKEVVPGARPWRPKNGEQRAVPLSPRAVAMLRDLPRRRRWVIDRMEGTAATANLPANDRHILSYLKTVLAKLGLEGTNHKFRHSFCTIAVLAGVNFFTLRRWVGHIDEEALKIYVHIADEEAQVTMRQLAERRRSRRAHRAGTAPRRALVLHAAPARCCCRRRHARLGQQRVFDRRQRPDHAHRPRRAELFSESRAPSPILRPDPVRIGEALRAPRPRRPDRPHPLRAAQTQSRRLGRARPRPKVHAAGGQWRRRTLAVCRQDAGPAVQPNLGFGCDRPRRQRPGMALPPECQLDRLVDLVPPPRKHRHRYHGVFAPNHKLRRAVTALAVGRGLARVPQEQVPVPGCREKGTGTDCCAAGASPSHDTSRIAWAKLLARGAARSFRSSSRTVAATSG